MKKWKDLKNNIITGGWVSPPHEKIAGENHITDEQYAVVHDCGIDVLFTMYENPKVFGEEKIRTAMELADKHDIGLFICDYRIGSSEDNAERTALLDFYQQYESFVGVNLFDEPGIAKFAELETQRERIKSTHPDCFCYVNLLPMYAYSTILKGTYKEGDTDVATYEEYETYVQEFTRTYKGEVLSYDFYPFRFAYGVYDENYFKQMSLIRRYAAQSNLPFWTFIQVTSWNPEIRVVEDTEIQWQVHTALAYGAQGIMYFTYWEPIASAAEKYRGAIISEHGEKGASYPMVRALNAFIARINDRLAPADFCGVVVPEGLTDLIPKEDWTALPDSLSFSDKTNLLIGVFKKENATLFYAVNVSFAGAQTFDVTACKGKNVRTYQVLKDEEKPVRQPFTVTLEAGDGILIEIEE